MLESLIRLAEAHARLMFKKDIEIYDAICVIVLMEKCVSTGLLENQYSCLMSREAYSQAKQECLRKLGLDPFYFTQDDFDIYMYNQVDGNPVGNHHHSRHKRDRIAEDVTEFQLHNDSEFLTHTHTNVNHHEKSVVSKIDEMTHVNAAPTVVVLDSQSSKDSSPQKPSPVESELPFASDVSLKVSQ